ncbi:hypothetical protein ACJZ2D_001877 [Fusarium nematophilum]
MTDFAFVVTDGVAGRPSAALRSHAVKNGLQRKTQTAAPSGPNNSQLTIRHKDTLQGRFRISDGSGNPKPTAKAINSRKQKGQSSEPGTKANKSRSTQASITLPRAPLGNRREPSPYDGRWNLVRAPSQGRGDPFSAFPVPLSDNDDKLIRFFVSRFDLRATIAYIRKQWWEGYAFSDPLIMHTTLGLAAALWSQLLPDPRAVANEGCKKKTLAIQGIRERLDGGTNDIALIGTIANLANIEGTEGNYKVACVHLRAVDLLIRARGGYNEPRSNVNVARVINWSDIQAAIGLGTKPMLPMILDLETISLPFSVLRAAERPSLSHLEVFEADCGASTVRDSFALDFRVLINVVDHHLQTTLGGNDITVQGRLLLTAAHVFFYMTIRELPPDHHIPLVILARLRGQLQDHLPLLGSRQGFQHGLLWCLVIGAAAAWVSKKDWAFFSANLSRLLVLLDIQSLSHLKEVLAEFLWHDQYPGVFLNQYGTQLFN